MTFNDTFLKACLKQEVDHTPVWYMRQAGRYQSEYREIRKKYSLLEICKIPELCAEVTILPVQQLGVDAAILFSDIMVPLGPMGVKYDIIENRGPVLETPYRTAEDIASLRALEPEEDLPYVLETIKILARELKVPLIGFTGAPFTLASYIVEGGPSRNYIRTKQLMYSHPEVWTSLMDKLADMIITYLRAQVDAGAKAVQIFDSWVGALSAQDYTKYVYPTMQRIFTELKDLPAPKIYFGVASGELLPLWSEYDTEVIGLDWRVTIPEGRKRVGEKFAIQGNLDPGTLLAPWPVLEEKAKQIIDQGLEKPGFVFNLGHGIFPEVPGDMLRRLTEFIHEYSASVIKNR
ncbi:uroporphyrinogen decarboxylase [Ammoniphilus oxalaticus]|uniref:Uroporphyrinogen decarboxylase n=1 Tax=Ammoniphilus oxalaticus TaxID=66863 RepID=A0A419SM83_9BACL|nr:uroporphyrinogen decarboxylase [Ammoniphilus oxalaticus]RKD25084.1 uroporphyrinogen decarboxylase [Ammoniphilus oxalaticus]